MARNFLSAFGSGYIGVPYQQKLQVCRGGAGIAAVFELQWGVYQQAAAGAANIGVNVSCQGAGPTPLVNPIRSVYIDNLGSDVPVYVYFPDTKHTIAAPPGATVWYPCITNQLNARVVALGLSTNDTSVTNVYLTDILIQPFADLEFPTSAVLYKASASIQRGTTIFNTNFGTPALGDQTQSVLALATDAPFIQGLFGTPLASGFIYLTALDISTCGLGTSGGPGQCDVFIESTGVAGQLNHWILRFPGTPPTSIETLCSLSARQIKLDATQTWQVRTTNTSLNVNAGTINFTLDYTINPS